MCFDFNMSSVSNSLPLPLITKLPMWHNDIGFYGIILLASYINENISSYLSFWQRYVFMFSYLLLLAI